MKINCSDYFIGILYTGNISESVVKSALSRIVGINDNITIEVLLHPGKALSGEEIIWRNNRSLLKHYYSPHRQYEHETVKSASFKELVEKS